MIDYKNKMQDNEVLKSDRLILRPFTMDDIRDVYLYANDPKVTEYLTWEPHENILETEQIINNFYIGSNGIYAIELESEQRCIGCMDLRLDIENNKASFGFVLNSNYWNQGYMSESLLLTLEFVFTKLKLNRVESTYYLENKASGRVMEKCGMKYEGTGLQELRVKGIYHDVVHYAILKEDWVKL